MSNNRGDVTNAEIRCFSADMRDVLSTLRKTQAKHTKIMKVYDGQYDKRMDEIRQEIDQFVDAVGDELWSYDEERDNAQAA